MRERIKKNLNHSFNSKYPMIFTIVETVLCYFIFVSYLCDILL